MRVVFIWKTIRTIRENVNGTKFSAVRDTEVGAWVNCVVLSGTLHGFAARGLAGATPTLRRHATAGLPRHAESFANSAIRLAVEGERKKGKKEREKRFDLFLAL
jgi:hypothetical protein